MVFSFFFSFLFSQGTSPWDGAAHIQGGSSLLSCPYLETPLDVPRGVCTQ